MADEWNRDKLRDWLEDKPIEVSTVIAARSALRALPKVVEVLDSHHATRRAAVVLPTFCASAVARVAGNGPTARQRVNANTYAAGAARVAHAAAHAAARTARAAIDAEAAVYAANASAYAARAATADDATAADADDATAAWDQIGTDIELLSLGENDESAWIARAVDLNHQKLWHRGAPERIDRIWHDELRPHLLAADEGWQVWTEWYDAALAGDPFNEELEIAKALIPDDNWKQGPAHVNAIIAGLIEEHTPKPVSGRLRVDPETAQIRREPESVDNADRYRLAIDRVRERVTAIEAAGLGNQHTKLRDILDELQPALSNPDYTPGQVHGRFRSALRMIARAVKNGLLPEDDDVVDNLTVDLGDGVIDIEAASPEVKEAADQYRAARMQTPGPELANQIAKTSEAFTEAADKPEGDLARDGGEAFSEAMEEHGPRAPVTDPEERQTMIAHAWRLIRTARLKLPDKETRDKVVEHSDRWGKVGKAIEIAGGAVIGLLAWLSRFL